MDERERTLERRAAAGDPDADRYLMCYRISKLQIELPVLPEILKSITQLGRYVGQRVVEKDGMEHPCLEWQCGDIITYFDLRSGWKIGTARVHDVGKRHGKTHEADVIRYALEANAQNPCGEVPLSSGYKCNLQTVEPVYGPAAPLSVPFGYGPGMSESTPSQIGQGTQRIGQNSEEDE